jgi:hypothetical protein
MTRRRLLLASGVALAVLIVSAVWWAALPRLGVTKANCARIKPGMTQEEVEAILGGPPGTYFDGRLAAAGPTSAPPGGRWGGTAMRRPWWWRSAPAAGLPGPNASPAVRLRFRLTSNCFSSSVACSPECGGPPDTPEVDRHD